MEIARAGATTWDPAYVKQTLHPGDRGRTGERSHVLLRMHDLTLLRFGPLSSFEVQLPPKPEDSVLVNVLRGISYFFSRDKPGKVRFRSRTAAAAVRGTECVIQVDDQDRMVVTLLEGEVQLSNALGSTNLGSGEQGVAEPGRPPSKTPMLDASGVIQWLLYYPGVLDAAEIPLTEAERAALAPSLAAYQSGDLRQALERYPAGRPPGSAGERIYFAALLLSAGDTAGAEGMLSKAGPAAPLIEALQEVIAAVLGREYPTNRSPALASEWLARSFSQQKNLDLPAALESARRTVAVAPGFGFGWARRAELEFSFGHLGEAERALEQALRLSPRNAQAHALRGFMLSARNRIKEAAQAFEAAIALDATLGNAWLGRGLCRLRRGDKAGGVADLEVAAALEPNRSLLRSYLGKAFAHAHDPVRAEHELMLARKLDPGDPTPWLYAALVSKQLNRVNEGIRELERSVDLNENRQVYRSRLLLDQDRAVRRASLATLYQRAGLADVSVREAARAVTDDYANPSAHQFLAESYHALRDPTRFNLRYETAWFNEHLLSSLLAPVGGGPLAQNVTSHEYSRLFGADGLGLTSDVLWRSDGQFNALASQYGSFGNSSYALDLDYQHNSGVRPNNELDRLEWYTRIQQQLTPQDSVFLLAKYQDYHSGDNFQYFFPTNVRRGFSYDESQDPNLLGAYHREWSPGVHTLVLGGWLQNHQRVQDTNAAQLILFQGLNGQVTADATTGFDVDYQSDFGAGTAEINQIIQRGRHTLVFGARFQMGEIDTRDRLRASDPNLAAYFNNPAAATSTADDFARATGYAYYTLQLLDPLRLTAGLAYDTITFPANYRNPPIAPGDETRDQFGPKAALVWTPRPELTLRGAYARSLGGTTLDQSYRLEPAQLAGFVQSYRTVVSESLVGSVSAPELDTAGLALDLKLRTGTYLGLTAEWLQQEVRQSVGVFDYLNFATPILPGTTARELDYDEKSAGLTVNQLLGRYWSAGAAYRFTRSELHTVYPAIPVFVDGQADRTDHSDLHTVKVYLVFNHSIGFFARAESTWFIQENWQTRYAGNTAATVQPVTVDLPDETFPYINLFLGYRLPRQLGDVSIGLLNLADRDYHLNPLNVYSELPRERALMTRLRLVF